MAQPHGTKEPVFERDVGKPSHVSPLPGTLRGGTQTPPRDLVDTRGARAPPANLRPGLSQQRVEVRNRSNALREDADHCAEPFVLADARASRRPDAVR